MQKDILVIWDVMIDKYSFWDVKRLNPESPNPLLNITKEELRLGWSANVAANIASLDWKVSLIWLVWNDENKNIMNDLCKNNKIDFYWIKVKNFDTIVKQRFIENTYNQQLLRVDYEKTEIKEDEIIYFSNNILDEIKQINPKIIIISDYNKWIINKYLIKELKKIAKENKILLLADAKPKNYELFQDFYLIKPNFKEFCAMMWEEIKNEDSQIEEYWIEFIKKMNTNLVITRWAKWASLITKDKGYYHIKTQAQKVFDVSGAGDTFIATIAYALNKWYDLKKAVHLGNKASGIVVEKVWTAIIKKEELF